MIFFFYRKTSSGYGGLCLTILLCLLGWVQQCVWSPVLPWTWLWAS